VPGAPGGQTAILAPLHAVAAGVIVRMLPLSSAGASWVVALLAAIEMLPPLSPAGAPIGLSRDRVRDGNRSPGATRSDTGGKRDDENGR